MNAVDTPFEGQPPTADDLQVVRAALASRPEWSDLAQVLSVSAKAQGSAGLLTLAVAFGYQLMERENRGSGPDGGAPFTPGWVHPTPLADAAAATRAAWRGARDAIDDPIATARLSDLLYVAEGKQTAHRDGSEAAGALIQIARADSWQAIDRAPCMSRALEILGELGDQPALADAAVQAVELVDDLLAQEHFGPPMIVMRAICSLKPRQRPDNLGDLFDRMLDRFPTGNSGDAVYDLAERSTQDSARRGALRAGRVQTRIGQARETQGLVRATHLHRALELARRYGLATEANELLHELQETPVEELGLETHEVSVEIPRAELEEEAETVAGRGANDLIHALRRMGAYPPPGGSNADLDEELASYPQSWAKEIFGTTVFGGHGAVPLYIANDPESKQRWERGQARARHAGFFGYALFGPMIDLAVERHGHPEHEALAAYFSTPLIGNVRGERVARAIELFWDGEYDLSAHVLVPRLEGILRDLARNSGITIVKTAERDLGGVAPLGTVLRKLRQGYPDWEWFDYLEALLSEPLAINLRNAIAHGLAGKVDGTSAALLIHAACWLALLQQTEAHEDSLVDAPPPDTAPISGSNGERQTS